MRLVSFAILVALGACGGEVLETTDAGNGGGTRGAGASSGPGPAGDGGPPPIYTPIYAPSYDAGPIGTLVDSSAPVPATDSGVLPPIVDAASPFLIDDMQGLVEGQIRLSPVPTGLEDGFWFTLASSTENTPDTFVPPLGQPFFDTPLFPPGSTVNGPTRAACVIASAWNGYLAGEGFNFTVAPMASTDGGPEPVPFDVSPYQGIEYWVYGYDASPLLRVGLPDDDTSADDLQSACNRNLAQAEAGQCDDDFAIQAEAVSPGWQEFVHPWSDFVQAGYGGSAGTFSSLDQRNVFGVTFAVGGNGGANPPLAFCVANVQFIP